MVSFNDVIIITVILLSIFFYLGFRPKSKIFISHLMILLYSVAISWSIIIMIGGLILPQDEIAKLPFSIGLISLGLSVIAFSNTNIRTIRADDGMGNDTNNTKPTLSQDELIMKEISPPNEQITGFFEKIEESTSNVSEKVANIESILERIRDDYASLNNQLLESKEPDESRQIINNIYCKSFEVRKRVPKRNE